MPSGGRQLAAQKAAAAAVSREPRRAVHAPSHTEPCLVAMHTCIVHPAPCLAEQARCGSRHRHCPGRCPGRRLGHLQSSAVRRHLGAGRSIGNGGCGGRDTGRHERQQRAGPATGCQRTTTTCPLAARRHKTTTAVALSYTTTTAGALSCMATTAGALSCTRTSTYTCTQPGTGTGTGSRTLLPATCFSAALSCAGFAPTALSTCPHLAATPLS